MRVTNKKILKCVLPSHVQEHFQCGLNELRIYSKIFEEYDNVKIVGMSYDTRLRKVQN